MCVFLIRFVWISGSKPNKSMKVVAKTIQIDQGRGRAAAKTQATTETESCAIFRLDLFGARAPVTRTESIGPSSYLRVGRLLGRLVFQGAFLELLFSYF